MRFLIDMNLSPLWVQFMAEKGFHAVHWSTAGQPGAADSEIFEFAAANDWVIFTRDLDFGMLLTVLRTRRPSVIQVRTQDVLPSAIGDIVIRAIEAAALPLETGALVPWTPAVTVCGCCRAEGIAGRVRLSPGTLYALAPALSRLNGPDEVQFPVCRRSWNSGQGDASSGFALTAGPLLRHARAQVWDFLSSGPGL
jgi:predicted nuclease of predicted toxin-antitoxin system